MNKQTFRNQDINAYLLGTLPDAETEYFDELSFTDDDFAAVLNSAEKDLIDSYTQGELSGAELKRFETFYLASPLRREKVYFSRAFQDFAKKSIAVQAASPPKEIPLITEPKSNQLSFFSGLNIFKTSRPIFQWSLALAAIAFMIFGAWSFLKNSSLQNQINEAEARSNQLQQREAELRQQQQKLQDEIANRQSSATEKEDELARLREELAQLEKTRQQERQKLTDQKRLAEQLRAAKQSPVSSPNNVSIASLILAPQLRGTNQMPTFSIPPQTRFAGVQLELEPNDFNNYQVALQNQSDNRIIWQSGKLKAKAKGENKALNISFPAKLLKSQNYSLVVSGISANGAAEIFSNYSFRAVLK